MAAPLTISVPADTWMVFSSVPVEATISPFSEVSMVTFITAS